MGNAIKVESGKDVVASAIESQDIDDQLLNGDDVLSVKANNYIEGGLGINVSLCMIIIYELVLECNGQRKRRT